MNKFSNENSIAAAMDATLKDPEFKSIFSTSAVLEKLAFNKKSNEEENSDNFEIEISEDLVQEPISVEASSPRADCIACGKVREGWTEEMGVCKCTAVDGCNPMNGCKESCSCKCKVKKAGVSMNDVLIKSAVNALLKVSYDLEEAGFDRLSAHALALTNELVVEAKSKKDKKNEKKLEKSKNLPKDKEKSKDKGKDLTKDKLTKDKLSKDKGKDFSKDKLSKDKLSKNKSDKSDKK